MTIINTNSTSSRYGYAVAVIDSNRDLNNHLTDALSVFGCTVFQAFSSEEIPFILSKNPDFIIIDPIYEPCNEFALRDYLSNPKAAGVIIFTSDIDFQRREYLFESGILELFSKDEPLDTIAEEFIRLFETIKNNHSYHVTIIGGTDFSQQKFKQLVIHRNYQLSFLEMCSNLMEKWNHPTHELPDLLLLDFTSLQPIQEAIDLINFVRTLKLSEIPIIFLLDETNAHLSSKFYRIGVNSILVRPYSYEKLLSKITHHLDYQISKKRLKHEQSLSNQLKEMIDSSSIVSKTDPRGIITYVNDSFCEITGYSREELIGKPHNIIRYPQTNPLFFEQMWEVLQSKKTFRGIIKNRRKDGSSYYVDSTISAIVDDNDKIIEYISIRHDITPFIERQHEIENQRRRVQNVLDAQTSLICMVDKKRGVVQSNRAFMEFLGIPSLDPKTRGFTNLSDLFLDADDLYHIANGERIICLDHLYEMRHELIRVAIKDHFFNHHVFSIHVEKIADKNFTEEICYLVSFEDVTKLNHALREAKAASEAESRFLATMSHEIRTPLNGILGFAELLGETSLDEQQQKYLQTIEYSGETLRQIINDILDIMKFDREQLELNLEPINLTDEIESIIYPFYSIAHKKEVDLLVFIDPKLPTNVNVDFLRLKQILMNFLSNAIKFTPSGKKVHVRIKHLKTVNDAVKIGLTVADEGIGVRPEHKADIFKPFIQADNSIAREFGGTGLGLNIVTRIVAAMNSKISFKSTYGAGSVFNVVLELTFNDESSRYTIANQANKKQTSILFEGLRILLAEDNAVNQLYIQELLNKLHIEHDLAHDGYDAVKKFMQGHYDLVLMDINMPNMDGITATQQILLYESESGIAHTPIIGLSADAVTSNITQYLTQGLDGYLVKPLRKSDLTTLLCEYFDSHAVTQESSDLPIHSSAQITESLTAFVASKIELPNEIVLELFKKFISNAETILSQLQEHNDDPSTLKMAIHSLKGISNNLYLEVLGAMCEGFEADLLTFTPNQKIQQLTGIREETQKIITQMKSELP